MYNEDNEALAAEYVLGTLAADEREHAEGLLLIDPGFEAMVRQWERRLGELNVMVEAVEPPAEVWTRIEADILASPRRPVEQESAAAKVEVGEIGTRGEVELPQLEEAVSQVPEPPPEPETETTEAAQAVETAEALELRDAAEQVEVAPEATEAEAVEDVEVHEATEEVAPPEVSEVAGGSDEADRLAALELSLFSANETAEAGAAAPAAAERRSTLPRGRLQGEPGVEAVYLANRLRRLRRLAAGLGIIAAVLAAYVAPDLIPQQLRLSGAGVITPSAAPTPAPAPARLAQDRLVAVLQQEPTAPAFLLTIDTRNRVLFVRNVSAASEPGRSYELWLIAGKSAKPRSLGVVGAGEFTQLPLPADEEVDTLQGASYEVSLEPAGGSPSGMPTGPVLFKGKAVESLPNSPPPAKPKT